MSWLSVYDSKDRIDNIGSVVNVLNSQKVAWKLISDYQSGFVCYGIDLNGRHRFSLIDNIVDEFKLTYEHVYSRNRSLKYLIKDALTAIERPFVNNWYLLPGVISENRKSKKPLKHWLPFFNSHKDTVDNVQIKIPAQETDNYFVQVDEIEYVVNNRYNGYDSWWRDRINSNYKSSQTLNLLDDECALINLYELSYGSELGVALKPALRGI